MKKYHLYILAIFQAICCISFFSIFVSNCPINIFAKLTDTGLPIDIPLIWWKNRSPNFMVLNFRTAISKLHRTDDEISLLCLVSSADLQAFIPSWWSIFGLREDTSTAVKILRNKFEKQVSLGHRVFILRLGCCKKLLLHVHFGCWAWKAKRIHSGIGPGPYLDLSSSGPTSYRVSGPTSYQFQEVPCERKAYLDPIWDRSQIYGA